MKSFIESQFAYCPLVWMRCDKTYDNHLNHLHKPVLMTVKNDNLSTFEKVLEKDHSVTIHARNLRVLATELYRTKENLAVPMMHEILNRGISNITSLTNWFSVRISKNSQLWFKGTQITAV